LWLVLNFLIWIQEFAFINAGQADSRLGKAGEANQGKQLQTPGKSFFASFCPLADAGHFPSVQGEEGNQQITFTIGNFIDNQALIGNYGHGK